MQRSLAHTVWECKYHMVWVPKNRRKVIHGKLKRDIGQRLRKLCELEILTAGFLYNSTICFKRT